MLRGKYAERRRICIEVALQRYKNLDNGCPTILNLGFGRTMSLLPEVQFSGKIANIEAFEKYANDKVDYFEICFKTDRVDMALVGRLSVAKTIFQADFFYFNPNLSQETFNRLLFIITDAVCIWSEGKMHNLVITHPTASLRDILMAQCATNASPEAIELSIKKTKPLEIISDSIKQARFTSIEIERISHFERLLTFNNEDYAN